VSKSPSPIPEGLARGPFTHAAGREAGLSRARMRARDLRAPTYGVRDRAVGAVCFEGRVRAFALALPGDVAFSHVTAARVLGLPMPSTWLPTEPLDVMRDSTRPRIERHGVRSHRGLEHRCTCPVDSARVTDALDTWADLSTLFGLGDLVAAGDVLVGARHELRPKDLLRAAQDRTGRGAVRLREAAALVRVGAASPWESKARVAFARWRLPEPQLNLDLYDAWGRWLARPDFVWKEQRVVGEYDGDQHRTDRRAWQYERERRAGLEDEGWTYVEMTSLSLTGPRESAALRGRLTRLLL